MLETRAEDGVAIWTLARPERGNGLGLSAALELTKAMDALEQSLRHEKGPRVLRIGARSLVKNDQRTWIAGGDLKELVAIVDDRQAARHYARAMSSVCARLIALPIPVIILIDGTAIGGGAEFLFAGDIRLASQQAAIELRQLDVGLATGYGGCKRLVDLVGLAKAQHLLLGGARLDAAQALGLGLFHEVHPDDDALAAAADQWTRRFLRLAPEAVRAQKAMLHAATHAHPGAVATAELETFVAIWGNPSHRQFLEKFQARGSSRS